MKLMRLRWFFVVMAWLTAVGAATMATGDASSFFLHGSGTTIVNLQPNGCPTLGLNSGSYLHVKLYYFAAAATYLLLDCTPTGSIFPLPTNVTNQTAAAVTLD